MLIETTDLWMWSTGSTAGSRAGGCGGIFARTI
jgi:hypothetical protein